MGDQTDRAKFACIGGPTLRLAVINTVDFNDPAHTGQARRKRRVVQAPCEHGQGNGACDDQAATVTGIAAV